jgi:hypothetical protein
MHVDQLVIKKIHFLKPIFFVFNQTKLQYKNTHIL